jgi:serine/threonine protein kinase/tetratricopeptide (TPR) repeat protein
VLDAFTAAWDRGESPQAEMYLARIDPADNEGVVELIYREFCLVEKNGTAPDPCEYFVRFPGHKSALARLLEVHRECTSSLLRRWFDGAPSDLELPVAGDSIGPFLLRRELGRGSFARVFLAEQSNLENRLVVVKVTTRPTREPWLLARVRHAHIVEIVSQAAVNDGVLQMICMPFLGGATLAAVLSAARRRKKHSAAGRDLLADLDEVAAPEYLATHPARPAREILAGLSYDQALAWVGARLADALDHAFDCGVAHGDVKPSNILVSADGNPMLLDFNLARDWSLSGLSAHARDPGGTLYYMAPERLSALATGTQSSQGTDQDFSRPRAASTAHPAPCMTDQGISEFPELAPHRADIYALGMVLLEALAGQPPPQLAVAKARSSDGGPDHLEMAALVYAQARKRSARSLIRESEAAGRSIARGLRLILEQCLDPDPARRYRRASELAEDLDRWRSDRPLAFTSEPFWSQRVPRWIRRQKRTLLVAGLALAVGVSTLIAAVHVSTQTLQVITQHNVEQLWDDPGLYKIQYVNAPSMSAANLSEAGNLPFQPYDAVGLETASRAMRAFDLLGPGDWRLRPEVRVLPPGKVDDLELMLMEQVYRYCWALYNRPDPLDWGRALAVLETITDAVPARGFLKLRHRVSVKLGGSMRSGQAQPSQTTPKAAVAHGMSKRPVPEWLDEYLLGVAADATRESALALDPAGEEELLLGRAPEYREAPQDLHLSAPRAAAQRALRHFTQVLALRPNSYWAHYRAAVACNSLGGVHVGEAAAHLQFCVKQRPGNPYLHAFRAACLWDLGTYSEAMGECNTAVASAPDLPGFFQTRAFIRASSRQVAGLVEDIERFELLSARLPRALWGGELAGHGLSGNLPARRVAGMPDALVFASPIRAREYAFAGGRGRADVDAAELTAREGLASRIYLAEQWDLASQEFTKILYLDPNDVEARVWRALSALEMQRFEDAHADFEAIFNHSGLIDYLRADPQNRIECFSFAASKYLDKGRVEEGQAMARRALNLAQRFERTSELSQICLARACAVAAGTDRRLLEEAADHLARVFATNPAYFRQKYDQEKKDFDPVRKELDALLLRKLNASVR